MERILFSNRPWVIGFFILVTLFMLSSAMKLKVDAGFSKLLPLQHEYMQTFTKHRQEFGGANRVLVALIAKEGDMFIFPAVLPHWVYPFTKSEGRRVSISGNISLKDVEKTLIPKNDSKEK